jgi:hypothetical protein
MTRSAMRALESRNGAEDVQLEPAGGRRRVDPLPQRHEGNAECLEFVNRDDQVPKGSPESIEPPADQYIETTPMRLEQQLRERRPLFLRTGDDECRSPSGPCQRP